MEEVDGTYQLNSHYGLFYVKDGVLLGVALCSKRNETKKKAGKTTVKKYVNVDDLCVAETARGQKIGPALLEKVSEITKGLGYQFIRLLAVASAKEFYAKNGFTFPDGENETGGYYLMEKTLSGGRRRVKTVGIRHARKKTHRVRS